MSVEKKYHSGGFVSGPAPQILARDHEMTLQPYQQALLQKMGVDFSSTPDTSVTVVVSSQSELHSVDVYREVPLPVIQMLPVANTSQITKAAQEMMENIAASMGISYEQLSEHQSSPAISYAREVLRAKRQWEKRIFSEWWLENAICFPDGPIIEEEDV